MWHRVHNAELFSGRRSEAHSVLGDVLAVATIVAISAISGAAVSLNLAGSSGSSQRIRPPAVLRAGPPAAPPARAGAQNTGADRNLAVGPVQQHGRTTVGMASGSGANSVVSPTPEPGSPEIAERELTFARGYAQRQAAAPAANAAPRVVPAAASSQRRSVMGTAALAALRAFEPFDGRQHQALAYAGQESSRRGWHAPSKAVARSFQDEGR
jgi:hypothetical protein